MARTILLSIALWGCGQEYEISQQLAPEVVSQPAADPSAPAQEYLRPVAETTVSTAHRPTETTRPRSRPVVEQQVPLGGGARTETVDFLFVIDDSSSMKTIIDEVFAGFDALAAEGVFPSDARIGVMSTLPANERIGQRVHPAAPNKLWLKFEPGFGDLVSGERIARFREIAPPDIAERFSIDGCDAWFAPDAVNAEGTPCLVAHTQELLFGVNVEAGLTALGQRLAKGQLFRTGAAANVIFVSDTHDPGLPQKNAYFDLLVAERPTGEQLAVTAARQQVTSSFRLHAIAPASQCGDEPWEGTIGPSYFEAANATGGKTLDMCTATPEQYVDMVRAIVTEGSVPTRPVVPLARQDRVGQVLVDGVSKPFHLSRDKKAVILDEPMPTATAQLTIQYAPAAATQPDRQRVPAARRVDGARAVPTR